MEVELQMVGRDERQNDLDMIVKVLVMHCYHILGLEYTIGNSMENSFDQFRLIESACFSGMCLARGSIFF